MIPEELRPLYLQISLASYLLVFLDLFFIVPVTQICRDRMSMVCFDLIIIMKVVIVIPSTTDLLGARRESCFELFRRKV